MSAFGLYGSPNVSFLLPAGGRAETDMPYPSYADRIAVPEEFHPVIALTAGLIVVGEVWLASERDARLVCARMSVLMRMLWEQSFIRPRS